MPAPNLDFNFYAGGIEDGILEVLKTQMQTPLGVKSFASYSGPVDKPDELEKAISQMTLTYPAVLASYAGGESVKDPATSPVMGRPLQYRHDCSFAVIVLDNNPQGETQRRRNKIYPMIAAVWDTLTGVRLKKTVEGVDDPILLNTQILEPVENIRIRMPNLTAYGIVIDTAFRWVSPDRTTLGSAVTEIIVGLDTSFGGS